MTNAPTIKLAAWLVIRPSGPNDGDQSLGLQRLHVAELQPTEPYRLTRVVQRLQRSIAETLEAIGVPLLDAEQYAAALYCGDNYNVLGVELGDGLTADCYPAEPSSGVNLDREPERELRGLE